MCLSAHLAGSCWLAQAPTLQAWRSKVGEGSEWQLSRQHARDCNPTCSGASSYLRPSSIDHQVVGNPGCHCLLAQLYLQQSKPKLVLRGLPSLNTIVIHATPKETCS